MVKYSVIESDSNPFSDYFKEDTAILHEKIQRHYVKTVELIVENNKSVLLSEFRKNKDRRAERAMYYVCGYDDCFYHFHAFDFDLDVVVIDYPWLWLQQEVFKE